MFIFDTRDYRLRAVGRLRDVFAKGRHMASGSPRMLWDLLQATGEARAYRLREFPLPRQWDASAVIAAGTWLPEACAEGLAQVQEYSRKLASIPVAGDGATGPNSMEETRATSFVLQRMQFDWALSGVEWILDRHAALHAERGEGRCSEMDLTAETAEAYRGYCDLMKTLDAVDSQLQCRLAALASATRGNELNEIRALMRPRAELPWWLDGTLEIVEFAKTRPHAWSKVQPLLDPEVFERDGVGPKFRQILFHSINRVGPAAPAPLRSVRADPRAVHVYQWALSSPMKKLLCLQLRVPPATSRSTVLELRIVRPVGHGRSFRMEESQGHDEAELAWIIGRLMILEGVVFRWTKDRRGKNIHAKVNAVCETVPGPLVLVDCRTNQVLEPFA